MISASIYAMAEPIAKMPENVTVHGRQPGSQYDQYLDGQVWKLTPDVDFWDAHRVRTGVHAAAKRRGMRVTVRSDPDGFLYIQALEPKP